MSERPDHTNRGAADTIERGRLDRIGIAITGFMLWIVVRILCATVRIRVEGREKLEAVANAGKGGVLMSWHGLTMVPVYWLRKRRPYGMISLSRDGHIEATLFRLLGWRLIRGSSKRGATGALIAAIRCLKAGHLLALTPDGPKGPSGEVKPGSLFMAQSSGAPIVPCGVAIDRFWQLRSWDGYRIPKPFARVVIAWCDPIYVTRNDDNSTTESGVAQRIDEAIRFAEQRLGVH